ncbi:short chain dehydrogenase [Seinonella peptonophila]|uniref:Short chain dehydrogenase n=1 Tax=Seinonella peptonophila TaxID=112248 RepID=A0A1M4T215_9BACL|nr:SDR family NAD(P)-dependent oxidoreductase [Seinonella peptonophila]SHE38438.1 short chain dehydrogenase [Seinonella peptonophila]
MDNRPLLVIIGSGPGISLSIAKKFGTQGFRVVLVSRTQESLERNTKELHEQNIESYGVSANAADTDLLKKAMQQIKLSYGIPDVLVYNVANIVPGNALSLTEQQLLDDFKVNTVGALTSAQQVIPEMIERKQGTLFFTGGTISLEPNPEYASLSIGKSGIRSLALSLADTLSPYGIYVGQILIADHVKRGTYYDPDRIADVYWDAYINRNQKEIIFKES